MTLRVRNWRTFQHYQTRRPPWVKLHRTLLDNFAFIRLPLASQALAPRLWLVACRDDNNDGVVNYTLNPGGSFSQVYVETRTTQWGTYDSTLIVGAIATCPSTNPTCIAPGAVPAHDCP